MTLPRSLDELAGLRAARWIRESTSGQFDAFGPDAQREQQDRAIERWGLVDTGLAWQVAHSGRTIGQTAEFGQMMANAGVEYDVLVVGYVSRFARDVRTAVNARHELHAAGAAILFADERILTSDDESWDSWAREAVEAESYSRKLARRIREGYDARREAEAEGGRLMARADSRRLKRVAAKALRRAIRSGGDGVKHPVPGSVTLSGGPMDGWVVKPDAPALQRDWCLSWPPTIAEKHAPGFYVADGPGRARWEQL